MSIVRRVSASVSRWLSVLGVIGVAAACGGPQEVALPSTTPAIGECPTAGDRTCAQTSDCGADFHCTGGHCFANQLGCTCSTVNECGSGHCARGRCYANGPGVPCENSEECGPNAHCSGGGCYANTTGSPCSATTECGPGSSCVQGSCN